MGGKQKIGILGGTFDPIHNGHIMLAKSARVSAGLDEIWFMPNRIPPHKENEWNTNHTKQRVKMVQLAVQGYPHFRLCTEELEMTGTSYTYKTMESLHSKYTDIDFYFIIGADSLFEFDHWCMPQRIADNCSLLAARRKDVRLPEFDETIQYLKDKYDLHIETIRMDIIEISSEEIRRKCAAGKDIRELVPRPVADYIAENHLYESGREERKTDDCQDQ